jgi:LDH2 family malate/lactate/ureidoglycolate dehydrogenase
MRIDYADLKEFTSGVLTALDLDPFSREAVTTGLCETSLRGVDSHGIRLLPHYVAAAETGRRNVTPNFSFTRTYPALGYLDADNAFGHAAGMKAIDHCLEMAAEMGMASVGVINSSHPGAMASFALRAARKGYIAFAFTHADALLRSHGGNRAYFGTNPICFAAPREENEPFCLDMATSVIPWNRILIHKAQGESLPPDVAADATGTVTTDPEAATCLLPTGNYKGYGLAAMVEILCGVFTGMAFGPAIPAMYGTDLSKPRKLGQFFTVMRTDGCVASAEFASRLQELTAAVRGEPAIPGEQVMLAGDPQILEQERRLREGIPLDKVTVDSLAQLADRFEIQLRLR